MRLAAHNLIQRFHSTHHRHADVEQDNLNAGILLDPFDCLPSILRYRNLVSPWLKEFGKDRPNLIFIIADEETGAVHVGGNAQVYWKSGSNRLHQHLPAGVPV